MSDKKFQPIVTLVLILFILWIAAMVFKQGQSESTYPTPTASATPTELVSPVISPS